MHAVPNLLEIHNHKRTALRLKMKNTPMRSLYAEALMINKERKEKEKNTPSHDIPD